MTEFKPPKSPGIKRKIRNICAYKEHDWQGEYYDGWLFLDCTKCEAKNIQHKLTERQVHGMIHGGYDMDVNKLPIRIDRRGNQVTKYGYRTDGYLDYKKWQEYFDRWKAEHAPQQVLRGI